jgi:hypothetical protein
MEPKQRNKAASFHFNHFNPERIPISHEAMLCRRKVHSSRAYVTLYLVFENVFVEGGGPRQTRLCPQVADVVCAAVFQRNQMVDFLR